jgi:hypothetical protein
MDESALGDNDTVISVRRIHVSVGQAATLLSRFSDSCMWVTVDRSSWTWQFLTVSVRNNAECF